MSLRRELDRITNTLLSWERKDYPSDYRVDINKDLQLVPHVGQLQLYTLGAFNIGLAILHKTDVIKLRNCLDELLESGLLDA